MSLHRAQLDTPSISSPTRAAILSVLRNVEVLPVVSLESGSLHSFSQINLRHFWSMLNSMQLEALRSVAVRKKRTSICEWPGDSVLNTILQFPGFCYTDEKSKGHV